MTNAPLRRVRGMSIIELLVAVVIGMLGTLVIFTVMSRFEPQKRTTTAGSDANMSGSYAMYELLRDIRLGGYGFATSSGLLGCRTEFRHVASGATRTVVMIPALIEDGGAGADTITVAYGTGDSLAVPVPVGSAGSLASPIYMNSNVGFFVGDVIAIGLPGATGTCMTTTLKAGAVAGTRVPLTGAIEHGAAEFAPSNTATGFSGSSEVVSLGNTPAVTRYSVVLDGERGALRATDLLRTAGGPTDGSSVADGVVNLQAQYGIDSNGDDVIDRWEEPVGGWSAANVRADPTKVRQIKAVRLGILVRSGQYEKPDASGICTASAVSLETTPLLPAAGVMPASSATAARSDMTNYRCFRHRIMETVIPIRNMTWSTL